MAPRLSEENWKYSFKLFCFQAPQKPFLERGGIVRDKLMHLFHCLRLMSDFCALWSTIASCRWLLPQSFVCPQNLCGWMSVCQWLCVDDGAACEELHCAQENVVKVLPLIPAAYAGVQNSFHILTLTGSFGKGQTSHCALWLIFQLPALCRRAAVVVHK